jgi:hypothetical protein
MFPDASIVNPTPLYSSLIDPFPIVWAAVNLADRLVVPETGAVTPVPDPAQLPVSKQSVPVASGNV